MFNTVAILDLGTTDLIIILAIVLLLFGSKKLPELAKSLGSSARELKKGLSEATTAGQELKQQVTEVTAAPQAVAADMGQSVSRLAPSPIQPRTSYLNGQERRF